MMPDNEPQCVCVLTVRNNSAETVRGPLKVSVIFCPLHKAAGDLYTALESLMSSLIQTAGLMVGTVEFAVGHSGNRELILQCRAALLKANPQRTQEDKDDATATR